MKTATAAVVFGLMCIGAANTSEPPYRWAIGLRTSVAIPLAADADLFEVGYLGAVHAALPLSVGPRVALRGGLDIGYEGTPTIREGPISLISGGANLGLEWAINRRFSAELRGGIGYNYGFLNDPGSLEAEGGVTAGGGFYGSGDLGFSFIPNSRFSVGVFTGYLANFSFRDALRISLSAEYRFPSRERGAAPQEARPVLELNSESLEMEFPVLYTWYRGHPLGNLVFTNTGDKPLTDLHGQLVVQEFMTDPTRQTVPDRLDPGRELSLPVFGLFNDALLSVTERTVVSGRLEITYRIDEKPIRQDFILTFTVADRNAVTWDDDRKAAAFVTAKDPVVLSLSKAAAGVVRRSGRPFPEHNTPYALGVYESLGLYGLDYVVDPSSPYKDLSAQSSAVDYLQFPRQTLEFQAGDCDDLTVLYCALLESVGIETAFVTVPGHIFAAYAADAQDSEIPESLIAITAEDRIWIPVELTRREAGFEEAVRAAGISWRRHGESARLWPVRDAWEAYDPVGFSVETVDIAVPEDRELRSRFESGIDRLLERELEERIDMLRRDIPPSEDARLANRIGVECAKLGIYGKAEEQFLSVLPSSTPSAVSSARINLGHLELMRRNYIEALEWYGSLEGRYADRPSVLLGIARSHEGMGNPAAAAEVFRLLETASPSLAARYAWLGGAGSDGQRSGEAPSVADWPWEEE